MGLAWGLSFSLGKIAVHNGIAPFGINQFQITVAGIALLIITLVRRKPIMELRHSFWLLLVIAILGAAVPGVLFYYASAHVQAGILAITIALIPLMTYGASIPLGIDTFSRLRFAGLILGVAAILFIAVPEDSLPDRAALPWIMLACVASLCYAAENIVLGFQKAVLIGPIRLAMAMNLIAAILLLPITIATDSVFIPTWPLDSGELAVIVLSLITLVIYTLFVMSVAKFGAVFASQTGYIVTLAGVFWGILIFNEQHSSWVWLSLILMLLGLAFVLPRRNETDATEK